MSKVVFEFIFEFDALNWLTSPVVNAMSLAEEGIYVRCLAVQQRDGFLWSDPATLQRQLGVGDIRTVKKFLSRWPVIFTPVSDTKWQVVMPGGEHASA
jgi:hypothetical protein